MTPYHEWPAQESLALLPASKSPQKAAPPKRASSGHSPTQRPARPSEPTWELCPPSILCPIIAPLRRTRIEASQTTPKARDLGDPADRVGGTQDASHGEQQESAGYAASHAADVRLQLRCSCMLNIRHLHLFRRIFKKFKAKFKKCQREMHVNFSNLVFNFLNLRLKRCRPAKHHETVVSHEVHLRDRIRSARIDQTRWTRLWKHSTTDAEEIIFQVA